MQYSLGRIEQLTEQIILNYFCFVFSALKIVLSAKLAEGKLRIIDTERVDEPKTRAIAKALEKMDSRSRILIVHPYLPDANFQLAHKNI